MTTYQSLFKLEGDWGEILNEELEKPYIAELAEYIESEYSSGKLIYPPKQLIFNALEYISFKQVQVVVVGQDPYHGPGQAHGLSFSVPEGVKLPPSLKNIFKELVADIGGVPPAHGCLTSWARQGVLLLNATLTVPDGNPLAHHGRGWERFTDAIIQKLAERDDPVIFVLWGKSAEKKIEQINLSKKNKKHLILTAPHPSPFSARKGFFGCRHFSIINSVLKRQNKPIINWFLN